LYKLKTAFFNSFIVPFDSNYLYNFVHSDKIESNVGRSVAFNFVETC